MNASIEGRRRQLLDLLAKTRRETRSALSALDPERVVHTDERAWRVRDVVGHLGVWNLEAARSLSAYAAGNEYFCIPSEAAYYDYNGPAADERRTWPMRQVWAEYEQSHDQLRSMVETLPAQKWQGEMMYPWHERGSVADLISIMMRHERVDHCDIVLRMTRSAAASAFVTANGIRLHYLDWGGHGPTLLFLAGMGCSVEIFDGFAPRFTDRFRVLGLDRRGHGDSDYPDTGYDVDTLAEDLHQALDALRIDRVILAGHSMACVELCRFTALHPERVLKLIFLDAAYDDSNPEQQAVWDQNPAPKLWPKWPAEEPGSIEAFAAAVKRSYPSLAAIWGPAMDANLSHSVKTTSDGKVVDKMSEAEAVALRQTLRTYSPQYSGLSVPVLSFFCTQDARDYISAESMTKAQQSQVVDYYRTVRQPYILRHAENFRSTVPQARIVVIPGGHHYCFIRPGAVVFEEMRKFLLDA